MFAAGRLWGSRFEPREGGYGNVLAWVKKGLKERVQAGAFSAGGGGIELRDWRGFASRRICRT